MTDTRLAPPRPSSQADPLHSREEPIQHAPPMPRLNRKLLLSDPSLGEAVEEISFWMQELKRHGTIMEADLLLSDLLVAVGVQNHVIMELLNGSR